MAPTLLAQYASTSEKTTHTITLSQAASKNNLFVYARSSGVMSIASDNASWVQVYSHTADADMKIWRLPSSAYGASKTTVTITIGANVNVAAVIWEENIDTAVTPYVTWGDGSSNASQWFTPAATFSGMTQAFALYGACWTSGQAASGADLSPTGYSLGFTELGDSGYPTVNGTYGALRTWVATAALTSLSAQTVSATFSNWVSGSPGSMTGVLAYKAIPDSPIPTANAGADQSVETNAAVTLTGSGTVTGDTITGYTWRQISGTAVTLSSTTAQNPTFTAPATAGTLVFGLTVSTATQTSTEDTVQVTVSAPVTITYGTTVALENAQTTGVTARTVWHDGVNQTDMPGFARKSYYLPGTTAQFSVDYNSAFTADVYRLGWYGGASNGARKVATVTGNPTNQPAPTTIANSNGATDCSNWSVNLSWAIPADATPGWYYMHLKGGTSAKGHILFCVSDKNSKRSIVVMSSDATWGGAYNYYGDKTSVTTGKSLYGAGGPLGGSQGVINRAMAVSMDRPIVTREGVSQTYFFDGEYPFLRFAERMGFNVAYTTNEQVDADPSILDGRAMVVCVGHNEYISQTIFDKFLSLAQTTNTKFLNLAGNDFFWRVRYGTTAGSNDYSNSTKGRVIWCRKDSLDGPNYPGGGTHTAGTFWDANEWTGTWQDTRWSGRTPSSRMFGDRFIANGIRNDEVTVGFAYKSKPIWRNITAVQNLTSGQSVGLGVGTLGMEWDEPEPDTSVGFGRTNLSQTSITISGGLSDVNGAIYNVSGTANHSLMMLRTPGGGYIFNANTTQWGWGLDDFHDRGTAVANATARQATLNVMYDLGASADSASVTGASLAVPTAVSPETYGIPVNILPPVSTASGSAFAPASVTAGQSAAATAPVSTASAGAAIPVVQGVIYVPPADSQNVLVPNAAQAVGQAKAPSVGTSTTATPDQQAPAADFVFNADVTLDDLVEEVLMQLHGYSVKGDQLTTLTGPVSASDLSFTVDDVNEISRGVIEIDNELVRVQTVDRTAGVVTILPRGRGWRQTVASAHSAGATVTMSPLVPRVAIGQAINDTILSLYPDIFGVSSVEFTYPGAGAVSFQLPTNAESVLSVRYKDPDGNWQKVRVWELENGMSLTSFTTGKSIRVAEIPAGVTVQVVYGRIPTALTTMASLFSTTGLAASHRDIVVLGAQARLIPSLDVARLSVRTVQADELDQPIQLGSAFQLAKEMQARFVARVRQEKSVLQSRYPAPVHFTR